jgi:hypothetical protein
VTSRTGVIDKHVEVSKFLLGLRSCGAECTFRRYVSDDERHGGILLTPKLSRDFPQPVGCHIY